MSNPSKDEKHAVDLCLMEDDLRDAVLNAASDPNTLLKKLKDYNIKFSDEADAVKIIQKLDWDKLRILENDLGRQGMG
jgi:hypothetical protein